LLFSLIDLFEGLGYKLIGITGSYFLQLKLFIMKKNMGNTDRITRLLLAVVFAALYFTNTITGTWGLVLLILAGVFVVTSLVSFCPLYTLVGLNTCPAKKE
jgi:fatty acid desaturase